MAGRGGRGCAPVTISAAPELDGLRGEAESGCRKTEGEDSESRRPRREVLTAEAPEHARRGTDREQGRTKKAVHRTLFTLFESYPAASSVDVYESHEAIYVRMRSQALTWESLSDVYCSAPLRPVSSLAGHRAVEKSVSGPPT